jgi:hypothetical protein
MADPQAQDTPATPDVASLMPDTSKSIADLTKATNTFESSYKGYAGQRDAIASQSEKRQEQDRAEYVRAYKAEGVAASEQLKPWDADKEHKRWESNPIDGFGSVGGLFAMVASAFTKAPMENAINGMAGAINSIKEGDEAGYKRAFESYKENVKLAEQRFKMQHDLYEDALSLGNHDLAASNAKLQNAAARMGDAKMLYLIETGQIKEIHELEAARAKSMETAMDLHDKIDQHTFTQAAVDAVKKGFQPSGDQALDKVNMAAAIYRIYNGEGKIKSAEQEAVGAFMNEAMVKQKTPNEVADGLQEIHERFSTKASNIEGYQNAKQTWQAQNPGQTMPAEEDAKLLQQFGLTNTRGGAGGASQSSQARKTRAIEEIMEKHKADGKPITMAEAEREFNKTVQIPSAHDVHQDDVQYQKAVRMETAMDEMDQLLLKHKLITGLGGTLSRPIEAVANILGSNETDRKQFQRVATELKEWGQAVVNDRTGRPLSQETRDAAVIFAGLNPGDTGPNTIRAITELRPVIKRIKDDIFARGQGKGPVSGGTQTETPRAEEPSGKAAPWLNDPVKP